MVSLEIMDNHAGQRLDKFLRKYLPEAPDSFFYKMLRKKNIILNGKRAEGREMLRSGDQVTLWLADETILKFGGFLPEAIADDPNTGRVLTMGNDQKDIGHMKYISKENVLYDQAYNRLRDISVIYEDAHVLILDKPAGVLTQQAQAGDMSLNEWMIGYLLDTGAISAGELRLFKPSVCNRLDRNTSGLVLCGKSLPGSQALSELIRSRAVRKFYRAVCVGITAGANIGDIMEIQGYLHKNSRTNRVVISPQEPGEYICTVYRPIKQYIIPVDFLHMESPIVSCADSESTVKKEVPQELCLSELEVELITGKPHQIRAHLASIGHPLVGDGKYGSEPINQLFRQRFDLRWQMLHAWRLEFPALEGVLAPLSGKSIQAPLPTGYESVLTRLNHFL